MHRSLCTCLLLLIILAPCNLPWAQEHDRQTLASPRSLHQLARTAATIFAGKVVSIHLLHAAAVGTIASVEITVQVEQGIRGVRTGQTLIFREWAGLWGTGERYRVGERIILFLYPPSTLGLTSPVGDGAGRLALAGNDQIVLTATQQEEMQRALLPVHVDKQHGVPLRDFARAIRRMSEE